MVRLCWVLVHPSGPFYFLDSSSCSLISLCMHFRTISRIVVFRITANTFNSECNASGITNVNLLSSSKRSPPLLRLLCIYTFLLLCCQAFFKLREFSVIVVKGRIPPFNRLYFGAVGLCNFAESSNSLNQDNQPDDFSAEWSPHFCGERSL